MWEMLRFQVLPGILLAVLVVASPANGSVVQSLETVRQNREGMMPMHRNAQGRLERSLRALPEKQRLDALLSKLRVIVEQSVGGIDE